MAANSNGTTITQSQQTDGPTEQWRIVAVGNGNVEIFNPNIGLALAAPQLTPSNNIFTTVTEAQWNGGLNEQWMLLAAGKAAISNVQVDNRSSGLVLTDPWFPTSYVTPTIQDPATGSVYEQWVFVPLADGYSLIVNAASGMALCDPGGSPRNGTQLGQGQLNGAPNEQWAINGGGAAMYAIINASSGLAVAAPDTSPASGSSFILWQWNGAPERAVGVVTHKLISGRERLCSNMRCEDLLQPASPNV